MSHSRHIIKIYAHVFFSTGTQKIHCARPVSKELLHVSSYSSSTASRLERVTVHQNDTCVIELASIKGYCLATYDGHWYLACVLEVKPGSNEVMLSFLHPHGPAHSFVYPSPSDELIVDVSDVLMIVNPVTATGRTYALTQSEMKKATSIINY